MTMNKVDREMAAAVAKHGPVTLPHSHIEEFYEKIEKKKTNIIANA